MSDEAAIRRIEAALAVSGSEHRPPSGWQARVLAAAPAAPRTRRTWWLVAPVLAAAALAVMLWPRGAEPEKLQLAVTVVHGSQKMRGKSANVGDTLHATARGGRERAVWVFVDDRIVASCPGPGPVACRSETGELSLELVLARRGAYSVIALAADRPLGAPIEMLDRAVDAAASSGARYIIEPLRVD